MSELATMARPYAAAVFKRAKETDSAAQWSETLAFMSSVLGNEDVSTIVSNPKVSKQDLLALLLRIFEGQVDGEAGNFLKLLVANSRLSLLPSIADIFEAYKAEQEGYVDVEVCTAYEFSEETKQLLAEKLEATLSKKIHMNVTLDPSLIGGVLVRAGDRVIDGSIRGQLQHMQKSLQ
jgi:F-type H+-transporting ATPase subunit delta